MTSCPAAGAVRILSVRKLEMCSCSICSFEDAGLNDTFLANVRRAKYDKPTPVQKWAIPLIVAGRDLMACAQTGSGKTVRSSLVCACGIDAFPCSVVLSNCPIFCHRVAVLWSYP